MKKQIPILFSTMMVHAILANRKSMTRRIVKPQPSISGAANYNEFFPNHVPQSLQCTYGRTGDLLYVREDHYRYGKWVKDGITKTGKQKWKFVATSDNVLFADDPPATNWKSRQAHNKAGNWEEMQTWYKRLGRFMPRKYARIWLEVTNIRVERLQNITEADAIAEGVEKQSGSDSSTRFDYLHYRYQYAHSYDVEAKVSFRTLWEVINGEDSWQANPWVWVISFKVLSTTGKPAELEKEECA